MSSADSTRITTSWTVHGLRSAPSTTPNTSVYEAAVAHTRAGEPRTARSSAGLRRCSTVA
ncbi:hypothetical protein [Kitasatospora fiedleri]|uniref:hypothetical protein n=1 Tax=Kitasatospora fiedleri TaxID=2991545 RepID=UPI00249CEFE9|nr:hypothetical protein [Kitasatospora fiedleri]